MELLNYFSILRRWAWLLLLGLVLGGLAGYGYSKSQTPIYSATTKLMVGGAQQSGTYSDYMNLYNAQQLALTYVELLKTRPLMENVSKRVGYPAGSASAQILTNTQIIQIQVQDSVPSHAMEVANMMVTVLIEQNETLQAGRFSTTEANIQTQADQVQRQIAALQGDITKISQQNIQEQLDQIKAQITPLQDESTKLQQEIAVLEAQNISFKTPTQEQKDKIAENNAVIIEKRSRISLIQPLLTQYQQVYSNLLILGHSGDNSGQANIQLNQLQSTLNVYQQLYVNLLNSLESVRLARMQNTPTVSQIEPATLPVSPVSPKPFNNAATTGAVGLMLAVGVVFLIEYLDDTIKTPEQAEQMFGLTVLGYIADVPKSKTVEQRLFVTSQPRSPISEAFRSLRTNLEFSGIDQPLGSILITSAGPGEGKSTVSANLAAVIAQGGKQVTLMDADLRRPSIHKFFNIPNRTGLTDVFRDQIDLESVRNKWETDTNVSVITTGNLPPNPTELLGSEKMSQYIERLKSKGELVIIDSPPSIVTDPQILAAKVDGVVVVVWPGHTQMNGIRSTMEQLKRVGANVVGIVFNRIPQNRGRYYGGYKHYSQYHYRSYHYYSEDGSSSSGSKNGGK